MARDSGEGAWGWERGGELWQKKKSEKSAP